MSTTATTDQEDDDNQQQDNENDLVTPVGSPDGIPLAGDALEAEVVAMDKDTLQLYLVQTVGRAR
jgi:hypothetical protein